MAIANWNADILSNFSNSDLTIFHNNYFHCFNVFICCLSPWTLTGRSRRWRSFTSSRPSVKSLYHIVFALSKLAKCHCKHFKWVEALYFSYKNFDPFFSRQKIAKHPKINLTFISAEKKNNNKQLLIISRYVTDNKTNKSNITCMCLVKIFLVFVLGNCLSFLGLYYVPILFHYYEITIV